MAAATVHQPSPTLLEWLRRHQVDYEIHEHHPTFTAAATARAEGVDARTFAKVVGVETDDGRRALIVLDAADRLDLDKVERALDADEVRLLSESELAAIAPDSEAGAIPAVGALYGLRVDADLAVGDDPVISFNAGSHRHTVRVDRRAWEHAAHVRYADLTVESHAGPPWAR